MARKMLTVRRKAYSYKRNGKTIRVKATSYKVPDRGRKGRGPETIKIRSEGGLGGPGYTDRTAIGRHRQLGKSVREVGYARTARRVSALRGLGKRTMSQSDLRKLKQDQNWLRETYGKRKKKPSKGRRKRRK